MATKKGWNIDRSGDVAVDFTADNVECNLVTAAGAVCGAGGVPAGAVSDDHDYSEIPRGVYHTKGTFVGLCAAAITDITVPIKPAAAGTITPADTDKDLCVGFPKAVQATVGGEVEYEFRLFYYAV